VDRAHAGNAAVATVILGVGIDLVAIGRVERMVEERSDRVLKRLFTAREIEYCHGKASPWRHFAARIAAKEAAFKALSGTEFARGIGWREIEVQMDAHGRPCLAFHGRATERAAELGVTSAWVSLTHDGESAAAVVVLEA
jgi:holo-[acyl-carrier protein] synthase